MLATIVFATLSALSNACAAVLQRLAVVDRTSTTARSAWRTAIDLVRQPVWLLGGLFLVATFGFQALALYFGPLSVILAVGTRGLAVLVLLLLSRYGSPARRAALFGAATAVVWSVDAAFVKQTVDVLAHSGVPGLLTHWPLYAMIATVRALPPSAPNATTEHAAARPRARPGRRSRLRAS